MELPVLYALTHPERVHDTGVPPFDPTELSPMTFEAVRWDDFPALKLGVEAGRRGGAQPAVFNAANEAAVALFLDGRIAFGGIARAIASALAALDGMPGETLDALRAADRAARNHVREMAGC
jgi:1-deoxy-D-xylulose-5-phosphate reductoisomerase